VITSLRDLAIAIVLLLVGLASCSQDIGPPGYNDALRELRLNRLSPGSDGYFMRFERTIRGALVVANRTCRALRPLDKRGSMLLYRIDAEGRPTTSMVYPSTPYATCMHERVKDFELPPPPKPDYWVGISIPGSG